MTIREKTKRDELDLLYCGLTSLSLSPIFADEILHDTHSASPITRAKYGVVIQVMVSISLLTPNFKYPGNSSRETHSS